jgi:hypothetical protein
VRDGVYLEFVGTLDRDLIIKSLENAKSGIRLMSTRLVDHIHLATVYVPNSKKSFFLNRIVKYRDEESKFGKHKNKNLVESIADIRMAVLSSFWTDDQTLIPISTKAKCEVWLNDDEQAKEVRFRITCDELSIHCDEGSIRFPERTVVAVIADSSDLIRLVESSDNIAEFRRVKETARFILELENADQTAWMQDLLSRIQVDDVADVAVCVLDSGANNAHPLLAPILSDDDCHAYDEQWGTTDDDGHGTLMCGLAAFGDLQVILDRTDQVRVGHRLESVKIINFRQPTYPPLYGYVISRAVSLAEIKSPLRTHLFCLAVTAVTGWNYGRPSSWSAAIDKIASGAEDGEKRLLLIAAGNLSTQEDWLNYPTSNLNTSIHDPGQSWNALTIGAYTEKATITDQGFEGFSPIAAPGELSPFSSTSVIWSHKWPAKPDVVMEGGNLAISRDFTFASECDDLKLISTGPTHTQRVFDDMAMTSAAVGLASHLAARIQSAYPDAWPETVRALVVHSAEWKEAMQRQFMTTGLKTDYANLLRICGYGVPSEARALECALNNLTLIAEADLQPYKYSNDGTGEMNDMCLHELPWPRQELLALGETPVQLRVTLSYFIEPSPGERGWGNKYRYPSHSLRFDVNTPTETRDEFIVRINKAPRSPDHSGQTGESSERWTLGKTSRDLGSVHSDTINSTGAELASCNYVGVYPLVGWWRERKHLGKLQNRARYSLIVSLCTPVNNVDIYTPVAQQVAVAASQEIATEV